MKRAAQSAQPLQDSPLLISGYAAVHIMHNKTQKPWLIDCWPQLHSSQYSI